MVLFCSYIMTGYILNNVSKAIFNQREVIDNSSVLLWIAGTTCWVAHYWFYIAASCDATEYFKDLLAKRVSERDTPINI